MHEVQLLDAFEVGNTLGEGVQWNSQDQSVWWTDIQERRLYRLHWPSRELEVFETPERLCAFAFTDREDCIVAAFERGFALYDYRHRETLWEKVLLLSDSGMRFNDGKIDRQGRFWAGTMVEDDSPDAKASLYRLEGDGTVTQMAGDIHISNGSCWSPDSSHFYFADSVRRSIYRYDFDARSGDIGNCQLFARTMVNRYPDGATVDTDGYLWSAQWRGARVERYAPDGSTAGAIPMPVSQPTCAAFGGENMNLLFVTSARDSLSEWTLDQERQAGNLFVFLTPFRGLPDGRFDAASLIG
ncbi:SMP-30/gluconolactonase/LRE family protein [Microbulbifer rhizosphaerae]|uniref:Sugar lactone lactonase YvrE n=1 Tax=Microbulbifer rhizosphaerae TaxID=1562603 RepID=A0A7W4WAV5_9GAMM|nr:SMP-30/gluconolactonase/LRE family protein [Microbulbifer rhizosphaerae]MBB3060885.1 sugar lactone lactonase YvrE [Microbulbifer rhizosphaerae]